MNEHEKRNQREMQALAVRTTIEYQNVVAPELLDTITGPDEQSIRAAAERAKATTQRIISRVTQEMARPSDVDPALVANVREGYGDSDQAIAAKVQGMSMAEWSKARQDYGVGGPDLVSFLGGGH
jgi:hypothetical protein